MKKPLVSLLFVLVFMVSTCLTAQIVVTDDDLTPPPVNRGEHAFTFSLATNGLVIGGALRYPLPNFMTFGASLEFLILRDDKEIEVIDIFGNPVKVNDVNQLFMIPFNLELKKRLFANDIENNFRPHIMAGAGAIYAMNFPRDIIVNDARIKPDSEYGWSYDIVFGAGADISTKKDVYFSIRPQYRYTYFPDTIAGKNNHSAFEIKFEVGGLR